MQRQLQWFGCASGRALAEFYLCERAADERTVEVKGMYRLFRDAQRQQTRYFPSRDRTKAN